jgi:CheY-like chemotaxis protein
MDFQMPVMDGLETTRRLRVIESKSFASTCNNKKMLNSLDNNSNNNDNASIILNNDVEIDIENNLAKSLQLKPIEKTSFKNTINKNNNNNNQNNNYRQFVIGCSANSDDETTREAFNAGIDRFIAKPFSLKSFLKVDMIEAIMLNQN